VRYVVLGIPRTATLLNLSEPTISNGVHRLQDAGILREATGRRRGRLYVYDEYLQLLNEGTTEPMS
jgi:DNA-binding Lrp family transcriptional regulator